jgi:hypothetical protein
VKAIQFYDLAREIERGNSSIHLNKSTALLLPERDLEAYENAKQALSGCDRIQCLFPLGPSAYGLRRSSLCIGFWSESEGLW